MLLTGRTTLDLPRGRATNTHPLARIIVDLAIAYHADQDLFAMDAALAPGSYVIDPAAELTGGLSLRLWGRDRTASGGGKGFVFTIGGYHPRFDIPDYYPRPARVGWRWARGPVTIRGQVYAALTDRAFMAGGELSASYDQSHGIQLQAWFTAWLDVLVQWKPFAFELTMGQSIGVAATVKVAFVRVRVSLEVGVSLELWGPPIGGRALVKVWFITFTLHIGSGRQAAPEVDWPEFRTQLPAPLSVTPLAGLLVDVDPAESAARTAADEPVLASADGFAIRTESAVPAVRLLLNGRVLAETQGRETIDVRPMRLSGVVSEQHVTIRRFDTTYDTTGWTVTPLTQDLPRALWGRPLSRPGDALDEDGLLTGCLSGIEFRVPPLQLGHSLGPVRAEALAADGLPYAPIGLRDDTPAGPPSEPDPQSIAVLTDPDRGIAAASTVRARAGVHSALAAMGLAPGPDGPVSGFAERAHALFTHPPMTTTAER
nr:DUF6603 domain-containing protein [Streptomyces orinoci]